MLDAADAINRFAYPDLPNEVQLIWRKELLGLSGLT